MKNTKTLLAGAALAGIIAGGATAKVNATTYSGALNKAERLQAGVLVEEEKGPTHDCRGKNACKGEGGCRTGDNGCALKNSCKGKGGCAMKDGRPIKKKVK